MTALIPVTPQQVWAAQIEAQLMRSAGLVPDPLVVKLANAKEMTDVERRGAGYGGQR